MSEQPFEYETEIEIVHEYALKPVGTRGKVMRSWWNPVTGTVWARVKFGRYLDGTAIIQTLPASVFRVVEDEEE